METRADVGGNELIGIGPLKLKLFDDELVLAIDW